MRTLLYPKTYATVREVLVPLIRVECDDGRTMFLRLRDRSGRGRTGDFVVGTRVKVYERRGRRMFRRVGS